MKDAPVFEKRTFALMKKSAKLGLKQTFAPSNMNESVK